MSLIDNKLVEDATTKQMIEAAFARSAKPEVDSVTFALLDARFRSFEITPRLDSVIAGVRAIRGRVSADRSYN